ncbi:hypothetical protein [Peribacillus frigoritolerans]|uniref:hypothetical protein n=1 Tax=Peribacillus frigoritolerans TaxID=450367 RepID=UPI0013A5D510|nr:hypothetical protein [Peribacillus frigoritolerans]
MLKTNTQEQVNKILTVGEGKNKVVITSEGTPNYDQFVAKVKEYEYKIMQDRLQQGRDR